MIDELLLGSAVDLAKAIRATEISSLELVGAYIEQIEAVNPQLNAVVQLIAERALDEARESDKALARGEIKGLLHGVPMTIKDSFDTAGVITTWGTVGRTNYVPAEDATVVARLREAGGILLGKTNTPEFTYSYETDNAIYGRTNNPYDLERTPGGSSGGAAAIVAAGGSPFDIGSDTGGSIRLPAHFCGIAGLKPTSGRVPRTGHAVPAGGLLESLTQVGPLARFVEDLALILPIISGPDGRDPSVAPVPLREPGAVRLDSLRGAFFADNGILKPSAEVSAAVSYSAEALASAGAQIEEARPPGIESSLDILSQLSRGWDGGAWARLLLERAGTAEEDTTLERYMVAETRPPDYLIRLINQWDQLRAQMLVFMDRYDFIVCPVNAYCALPHGTFTENYAAFSYTMTFNLTGWPAAVVRVGASDLGLPIGIQLVARPWMEEVALVLAHYLESVFGGWQRPSYGPQ